MSTPDGDSQPGSGGPASGEPGSPPPLFVNPDRLAPPAAAPPQFVKPGAAPSTQGAPAFVQPGATPPPMFVQSTPTVPAPGAPVFVRPDGTVAGPGGTPEPSPVDENRPWPWWLGPLAFVIALGVVMVLGIVAVVLSGGDSTAALEDNTHWLGMAQDTIWVAVVLLVPFLAVRYLRPDQLGLRKAPLGRSIGILLLCVFAFYAFAALYALALGLDEDSNTLLQDTGFGESVGRDIVLALLFTVAAPVAEELLFRGLLFRTLRDGFSRMGRRTGVWLGAIVSGVIFGGIHAGGGQDDFLPVLMALGVLLALAYHWSGTLYVPVAIHSINNTIATALNSEPSADWVYALIVAGPIISMVVLLLLTRFIRAVFPQEPPTPVIGPPGATPSGLPANL